MSLAELLGTQPSSVFIEQFYLQQPFALSGGCDRFRHLGSWESVEAILSRPDADTLVVRGGQQLPGGGAPSYDEARALHADGYTIVLRHVERRHAAIAEFAAGFQRDLAASLDAHIYCTPASQFGFGWHYDAEDVFILQTAGRKEYSLRKNTVNPWPVLETMPQDMGFEREIMPLMKCTLSAGDWLYIPGGYWHRAESCEDSISLAIGVMSTTALDLYDFLRSQLLGSLVWRQRLPIGTPAAGKSDEEARGELSTVCEHLGRDLLRMLTDPRTADEFLNFKRRQTASQATGIVPGLDRVEAAQAAEVRVGAAVQTSASEPSRPLTP
jgi:50S ribosomal protein L16 3-hydroxylase